MNEIEKLRNENQQLKILSENKSDIISITAHQLRTSLSALKWTLKMVLDQDVGKLSEPQSELISKAYRGNERVLTIVNDLMSLSHTEGVTVPYNFKKMDLSHLLDKIIFEFTEETKKKEIILSYEKATMPLPLVNCDEEMISVAIQNLIENAIKYSNTNGKVTINMEKVENEIKISVCDNGIGISPSDKDNIFKKFFRASNAIKKDEIGSGLGLFTTKNIVEKHSGKIWFENNQTIGTTFFISLPVA